jgi:hypothetical protein
VAAQRVDQLLLIHSRTARSQRHRLPDGKLARVDALKQPRRYLPVGQLSTVIVTGDADLSGPMAW